MKICKLEDCDRLHESRGYCAKHAHQLRQYGKILTRTCVTPNNFILEDDICRIQLFNIKRKLVGEAVIDIEDYEKCKDTKWSLHHKGYAVGKRGKLPLANHIIGWKEGFDADHKDRDRLNNRKENLRFATRIQNCINKESVLGKSGFKGVSWHKGTQRWVVRLSVNKIRKSFGYFKNKIEAAMVYDKVALKYHGDFACTNKMMGLY
jgi:hypothetical protein